MTDIPPDAVLIEIRGIHDGWSCARLPDGSYVNRRSPQDGLLYEATQAWIVLAVAREVK